MNAVTSRRIGLLGTGNRALYLLLMGIMMLIGSSCNRLTKATADSHLLPTAKNMQTFALPKSWPLADLRFPPATVSGFVEPMFWKDRERPVSSLETKVDGRDTYVAGFSTTVDWNVLTKQLDEQLSAHGYEKVQDDSSRSDRRTALWSHVPLGSAVILHYLHETNGTVAHPYTGYTLIVVPDNK
jgi:hypothetical protein